MFLTSMSGEKQITQMFPKTLDWLVGVGGRGRVRRHQPEEAVKKFEGFPNTWRPKNNIRLFPKTATWPADPFQKSV